MSTTIVYRVQAVKFPKVNDYGDDIILILHEIGSSNCYEAGNRRRARSWQASFVGEAYKVIEHVCEHAGYCEGGSARLHGMSHTTPEQYIARHRKAIKEAVIGVDGAKAAGFELEALIQFTKKPDKHDQYRMDKLIEAGAKEATPHYYDRAFSFDLNNPADLKLWAEYARVPAWSSVRVSGPGERSMSFSY